MFGINTLAIKPGSASDLLSRDTVGLEDSEIRVIKAMSCLVVVIHFYCGSTSDNNAIPYSIFS